jgi:hypothetical protein
MLTTVVVKLAMIHSDSSKNGRKWNSKKFLKVICAILYLSGLVIKITYLGVLDILDYCFVPIQHTK